METTSKVTTDASDYVPEIEEGRRIADETIAIADNCYAMTYIDANFTIFTDSGDYCLDFYVDGEHADYFILTNPEQ